MLGNVQVSQEELGEGWDVVDSRLLETLSKPRLEVPRYLERHSRCSCRRYHLVPVIWSRQFEFSALDLSNDPMEVLSIAQSRKSFNTMLREALPNPLGLGEDSNFLATTLSTHREHGLACLLLRTLSLISVQG